MEFFATYQDQIIEIVCLVFGAVISLITFFRTGSISKTVKNFKEVLDVKYKTVDTNREIFHSQTFTPYRDNYVLDTATNELEKLPNPENVQESIQSYIDTSLQAALEKYLPNIGKQQIEEDDLIADYTESRNDLAAIGDAMELAEEYRDKFNLPDTMSIADIYQHIGKYSEDLKNKMKVVSENNKSGGNDNVKVEKEEKA